MNRYPRRRVYCCSLLSLLALRAAHDAAAQPAPVARRPTFVAGFEHFRDDDADAVAGGLLLLGELNCISCHAIDDAQASLVTSKRAPRLAAVAERANPAHLRDFIADPHATHPGTTMPDPFSAASPAAERERTVDALVHFLVSLRPGRFEPTAPDHAAAERGDALFHRVGCVACHAPRREPDATVVRQSVGLDRLERKYAFDGLRRFLRDPLAVRPSGRMPHVNLAGRELDDITHYLLRETKVPGALAYKLYRGRPNRVDEIADGELVRTGLAGGFGLDVPRRRGDYGLRFDGFLEIARAGEYTFHVESDDGSRLSIGETTVVDNDGRRRNDRPRSRSGSITLEPGWHAIAVDFFQRGRGGVLTVEWEGPGVPRGAIPASSLRSTREPIPAYTPFLHDPQKAAQGKALFVARGCVACHDLEGRLEGAAAPTYPALSALRPERGCLSPAPAGAHPVFHLDAAQRSALRAAVTALKAGRVAVRSVEQTVHHTLATLNCYACHARDDRGGVSDFRADHFTANASDLGEEGRIPPTLTGVGDKLTRRALVAVLTQAEAVRPYMDTRMPQFGEPQVAPLADAFIQLDRRPQTVQRSLDPAGAARQAGRKLMGTTGLSCVACHKYNRHNAAGMQAMDLVDTTTRINRDWFHRYMRDPNRYRPDTRMPQYWLGEKGPDEELLGGDTTRQIEALWTYLADGRRAILPEGLSRQSLELIVGGEAVVYRGKIWEAGFRGICVGFPEQVNLAFDAEQMRLSLLWKGRFLNVAPHWRIQGMGRIRPMGHDVLVFPHGPAFAVLASPDAPWPREAGKPTGFRFRGYELDELQRPTFLYSFRSIQIEDYARATEGQETLGLARQLSFASDGPVDTLWFRAAAGGKIVAGSDGAYRVDDRLTLHVRREGCIVRDGDDGRELIVPVLLRGGKTQLVLQYIW